MKKVISVLVAMLIAIVPAVFAVDVGGGIGVDIGTEDFPPLVWLCDNRIVTDDAVEPGRMTGAGERMVERINNYAFEGEQIAWDVLVMDKNGAEKISDVYATVGSTQGVGNDIEANCRQVESINVQACNARILEEAITVFDPSVMRAYRCTLTVETPNSMQGEYFITVEAEDLDGLQGTFAENEYWFLNPEIALSISDSSLDFGDEVRPGTASYSQTLLVGNDAEAGSGVMLDMYIAGTDFYDPASSGAKCPVSNILDLNPVAKGLGAPLYNVDGMPTGIAYYATNGAYSTQPYGDAEGYVRIPYGDRITQGQEIVGSELYTLTGPWTPSDSENVLAPGAEMAITFRLVLPEPCNGDFSDGDIFFWGEAI